MFHYLGKILGSGVQKTLFDPKISSSFTRISGILPPTLTTSMNHRSYTCDYYPDCPARFTSLITKKEHVASKICFDHSEQRRKDRLAKKEARILEISKPVARVAFTVSHPRLCEYMTDMTLFPIFVQQLVMHVKLNADSVMQKEEFFRGVFNLLMAAFKHGEKEVFTYCMKAIIAFSTETQGEFQVFVKSQLKELEYELLAKLQSAMHAKAFEGNFSLNLMRLYEFQLVKAVPMDTLYDSLVVIMGSYENTVDAAKADIFVFILLNMREHVVWCLQDIVDGERHSVSSLLNKRNNLLERLEDILDRPPEAAHRLTSTVITILAEMWCLFRESDYSSTELERLGFFPTSSTIEKHSKVSRQLFISDAAFEYKDAVKAAAAKLIVSEIVPKV